MDLDADGSLWRFRMEKVLDVEFVSWGDPDPDGTEVCWRLERRRMRPEYEWHPLRET